MQCVCVCVRACVCVCVCVCVWECVCVFCRVGGKRQTLCYLNQLEQYLPCVPLCIFQPAFWSPYSSFSDIVIRIVVNRCSISSHKNDAYKKINIGIIPFQILIYYIVSCIMIVIVSSPSAITAYVAFTLLKTRILLLRSIRHILHYGCICILFNVMDSVQFPRNKKLCCYAYHR